MRKNNYINCKGKSNNKRYRLGNINQVSMIAIVGANIALDSVPYVSTIKDIGFGIKYTM